MKLTRRQLKKIVESLLLEEEEKYFSPGVYFMGLNLIGKACHGFVVVIENSGKITGYHGGPGDYYNRSILKDRYSPEGKDRDLLVTWEQVHTLDEFKDPNRTFTGPHNLGIDAGSLSQIKSKLTAALNYVEEKEMVYSFAGPNSNTTAWYLLKQIGKDEHVNKLLETIDFIFPGKDSGIVDNTKENKK